MEFHMDWTNPAPGMSRYDFTDGNGYRLGPAIEARTAEDARAQAIALYGTRVRHCTHLGDHHGPSGMDAIFFYGPDAVGG